MRLPRRGWFRHWDLLNALKAERTLRDYEAAALAQAGTHAATRLAELRRLASRTRLAAGAAASQVGDSVEDVIGLFRKLFGGRTVKED
jgi:hypothetical protein